MKTFDSNKTVKKKYQRRTLISLLIFVFLFSSNYLFGAEKKMTALELGTQLVQANLNVTYAYSEYDESLGELVFVFSLPLADVDPLVTYAVSAKVDKKTNDDLPVNLQKMGEDKYVAFIQSVPKKWQKMSIALTSDNGETTNESGEGYFYLEHGSVTKSSQPLSHDLDDYTQKFADVRIKTIESDIAQLKEKIDLVQQKNKKLSDVNRQLTQSKEKEVGEELDAIESKILANESAIESNKAEIQTYRQDIKDNKERLSTIN